MIMHNMIFGALYNNNGKSFLKIIISSCKKCVTKHFITVGDSAHSTEITYNFIVTRPNVCSVKFPPTK